jgi:hypothetical protein
MLLMVRCCKLSNMKDNSNKGNNSNDGTVLAKNMSFLRITETELVLGCNSNAVNKYNIKIKLLIYYDVYARQPQWYGRVGCGAEVETW